MIELLPWVLFLVFVISVLALDLGVFHRDAHAVTRREALTWTGIWVGMAMVFNIGVYLFRGTEAGFEWTTGYLIEQSLSVDNVFVWLLIFARFGVPAAYQHRVLFWGVVGALVLRAIMIAFAGVLLDQLLWTIYVFGAFLVFTGFKIARGGHEEPNIEGNPLLKLARRFFPVTNDYDGQNLTTVRDGVRYITPLFLVLILIESTDLVFAVDSIPAIYAVTDDPFIVFTSNIFAILGLRSLFFVISGYLADLKYLTPALAAILTFVGMKMLLIDIFHIPSPVSLLVVVGILAVAIGASLLHRSRMDAPEPLAESMGVETLLEPEEPEEPPVAAAPGRGRTGYDGRETDG